MKAPWRNGWFEGWCWKDEPRAFNIVSENKEKHQKIKGWADQRDTGANLNKLPLAKTEKKKIEQPNK